MNQLVSISFPGRHSGANTDGGSSILDFSKSTLQGYLTQMSVSAKRHRDKSIHGCRLWGPGPNVLLFISITWAGNITRVVAWDTGKCSLDAYSREELCCLGLGKHSSLN